MQRQTRRLPLTRRIPLVCLLAALLPVLPLQAQEAQQGEQAEQTPQNEQAQSQRESGQPGNAHAQTFAKPAAARNTPTLDVDQVRIGMKGYGLSVFQGTKVEPFTVEVISIAQTASRPRRSVIWIRSKDPRMVEYGPVQGMSGSPIYLWTDGEAHEPGKGGKLIGAFAFGFSYPKQCIVGVQPIEYMHETAQRATDEQPAPPKTASSDANDTAPQAAGLMTAKRTFNQLARMAQQSDDPAVAPRLDAMRTLLDPSRLKDQQDSQRAFEAGHATARHASNADALPPGPSELRAEGRVMPMYLPMAVGSPKVAQLTRPLLQPMGIDPVATANGLIAAPPPQAIDADAAQIEPGGVLALPLAFGDVDLSASGTVTDVRPDGTVLGLGHAMFGQGESSLPMATGYVHFVMPRLSVSFKMAGSLAIQGSITRDELAGVVGQPVKQYETAPVRVTVNRPGKPPLQYNYEVVHHDQLTPTLATLVAVRSINVQHIIPPESTVVLHSKMQFDKGHELEFETWIPGDPTFGMMMEVTPPITLAMQNPHQRLKLQSMEVTAEIRPQRKTATITNARLEQTQVKPGETVGVTVWIQPYGQKTKRLRTTIDIPADLPDGDYPLVLSDANTYLGLLSSTRPHLFTTRNVDDLMQMAQRILSVDTTNVHLTMRLPEHGVAIGRQELPQLPSSRRAMIYTPTSTIAQPFMETLEQTIDTDLIIQGSVSFTVHVRSDMTETLPPPDERNGP